MVNFFRQNKEVNDRIEKKGKYYPYYMFDKATLTFLGANVMYYYILISVVYVIERALTDKKYKFKEFLEWDEAIANYVILEASQDVTFKKKSLNVYQTNHVKVVSGYVR